MPRYIYGFYCEVCNRFSGDSGAGSTNKYCSNACKMKAYRERRREKLALRFARQSVTSMRG